MARKFIDRASESTTTSGTGAVALHGALPGFTSFASGMSNGDVMYYFIEDSVALQWEVQDGIYSASANTLSRPTPLASSNGGALVNFAGNAGTRVSSDIPAALMQFLFASAGAVASVTDGSTTVTNAATIDFTSGATVSNVGGVAAVAISAGSPLEVLGGGGTITNATTINFTSGATASSGGAGVANVAIGGGGGGGSYAAGLGIAFTGTPPTTIGNTGNLVLPGGTGTLVRPTGIQLATGNVYGVNTAASYVYAGGVAIVGGSAIGSTIGGNAYGGSVQIAAGNANIYGGSNRGYGAAITAHRGQVDAGSIISGGGVEMYAGNGVASGGDVVNRAGNAGTAGTAGNVVLQPGTGGTNGVLLVSNIGTIDPHIAGAVWQQSVATVGFVLMRSQG
jgi:hypothetical protein